MGRAGRPTTDVSGLRESSPAVLTDITDVAAVAAMEEPLQFAEPLDSRVSPLLESLNKDPLLSKTIHDTGMTEYELGQYANAWLDGLHPNEDDTVVLQPTHRSHQHFIDMAIDVAGAREVPLEIWWPDEQDEEAWRNRFRAIESRGQNLILSSLAQPIGRLAIHPEILRKMRAREIPHYEHAKGYDETRWNVTLLPDPEWAAELEREPLTGFGECVSPLRQLANDLQSFMHGDQSGGLPAHIATLKERARKLNALRADTKEIHIEDPPRTDLRMELTDATEWVTVDAPLQEGSDLATLANTTTEEVFATPRANSLRGHFTTSRPLHLEGTGRVVEQLRGKFDDEGELVELEAWKQTAEGEWEKDPLGQKALETYFRKEPDENWPQCGEVGLVDSENRVAKTGRNYLTTFIDEHGGLHIAIGDSYAANGGGEDHGGSVHREHLDVTIGNPSTSVHIIRRSNGEKITPIRNGVWQDLPDE